jgi:hypothetical protein
VRHRLLPGRFSGKQRRVYRVRPLSDERRVPGNLTGENGDNRDELKTLFPLLPPVKK